MAHENPLLTLGVPQRVLVHEQASGAPENVLKIAEANYRTLSKHYHHDLPGGDVDLMVVLGDAIAELRDPDALKFYINELVGREDIDGLYQQKHLQELVSRDTGALTRLAEGFAFIDQFEVLGIKEPTTYLTDFEGQRVVLDVLSPSKARARVTNIWDGAPNVTGSSSIEVGYLDGTWREEYSDDNYKKHWQLYTKFNSDELVKLVGFVPVKVRSDAASNLTTRLMLDSAIRQVQLRWELPQHCWFLPELLYAGDRPRHASCVLYKRGRFAITGEFLGSASLKP